ncbi:MAG TPA: FlgD immunoglobulin-like domain containing protein [Candidatus Krumholzibacteria bacterium]|nr:FlgD immunoglobulin-like domain containing protein [Candidatus Krumholzibacteria bacterium]
MRFIASIATCAATLLSTSAAQAGFQFETPLPTAGSAVLAARDVPPANAAPGPRHPALTPLLQGTFDSFNYDDNATFNSGNAFIPVDATCAVGPGHVMTAGNAIIEWRTKDYLGSAPQYRSSLKDFFAPIPAPAPNPGVGTSLGTYGFNPRVLYDQYAGRFLVFMLERWDVANGNASNESRILLAVSRTSDPNDGFWYHAINSKTNISGADTWIDYPGVAVDDKVIYLTGNMFGFNNGPYGGVRLWIIRKAAAYADDDPSIFFIVRNPYASAGFVTTTIPAQMFGAPQTGSGGRPMGTFLAAYSGITDGTDEYLQITEVTDPLQASGGPFFNVQQLDVGNIDNPSLALPDAAQATGGFPLETNDRRMLSAVWRNNNLYCSSNIRGAPLSPDANQCVARWWRLNTTSTTAVSQADAGNITGEDIAVGTHTYYPCVMVDADGNMAVNFSASGTTLYAGAYYTTRLVGDTPGSTGLPKALAVGQDFYKRYFGGSSNRWGDYNGIALSQPDENEFWIFNQYAGPRGSSDGVDDGRWHTRLGRFRIKTVTAITRTTAHAALSQNVPNPFNPVTTISYTLPAGNHVSLSIYDASGRLVRTLVDEVKPSGSHQVTWNGMDNTHAPVSSGVYFYRLQAGAFSETKKMVLLK